MPTLAIFQLYRGGTYMVVSFTKKEGRGFGCTKLNLVLALFIEVPLPS